MSGASHSFERHTNRGAGEAADDLIIKLASPLADVVTATALSVLALVVMVIASAVGFEETSTGILGGTDTSTNGFAVFLAIVSGAMTLFALVLYVNGLYGLREGIRNVRATAERRQRYWLAEESES